MNKTRLLIVNEMIIYKSIFAGNLYLVAKLFNSLKERLCYSARVLFWL